MKQVFEDRGVGIGHHILPGGCTGGGSALILFVLQINLKNTRPWLGVVVVVTIVVVDIVIV